MSLLVKMSHFDFLLLIQPGRRDHRVDPVNVGGHASVDAREVGPGAPPPTADDAHLVVHVVLGVLPPDGAAGIALARVLTASADLKSVMIFCAIFKRCFDIGS